MSTVMLEKLMGFLSEKEQQIVHDFNGLNTDDQLAVFYYIYELMGESITPAAPTAADPELAPTLLDDFYQLSHEDQLNVMREIVEKKDTQYSRYYGALTENNRLVVWYAWAKSMGDTVVDMPNDYKSDASKETIGSILKRIENLEFQQQISVLRAIAADMGYSDVRPVSGQAETGQTDSL